MKACSRAMLDQEENQSYEVSHPWIAAFREDHLSGLFSLIVEPSIPSQIGCNFWPEVTKECKFVFFFFMDSLSRGSFILESTYQWPKKVALMDF